MQCNTIQYNTIQLNTCNKRKRNTFMIWFYFITSINYIHYFMLRYITMRYVNYSTTQYNKLQTLWIIQFITISYDSQCYVVVMYFRCLVTDALCFVVFYCDLIFKVKLKTSRLVWKTSIPKVSWNRVFNTKRVLKDSVSVRLSYFPKKGFKTYPYKFVPKRIFQYNFASLQGYIKLLPPVFDKVVHVKLWVV